MIWPPSLWFIPWNILKYFLIYCTEASKIFKFFLNFPRLAPTESLTIQVHKNFSYSYDGFEMVWKKLKKDPHWSQTPRSELPRGIYCTPQSRILLGVKFFKLEMKKDKNFFLFIKNMFFWIFSGLPGVVYTLNLKSGTLYREFTIL